MLDIQFIRENRKLVEEKTKQKGIKADITKLLELDAQRRGLITEVDGLQEKRNKLAAEFQKTKPTPAQMESGKSLKEAAKQAEEELQKIEVDYLKLLKQVPNMPLDDVPVGASEDDNVVAKKVGKPTKLSFKPKNHWELAQTNGWIDKERAAKVAGSRFAYIKGDLVKLQFALIQFVIEKLTNEATLKKVIQGSGLKNISSNPFIPVLPPAMVRTEIYDAMDRLEPRDDRYKVGEDNDNLWLQGSAEHTLGPMYAGESIQLEDYKPLRYLGYATSFRREAGTYGKDTEGIIRMHQFDKLEMESFTTPEAGLDEHLFMVAIQEYLMQQLELPYQVIMKCTADIGKPNARGIDIEAWLPGNERYLETHTADYMTDYQSRRLGSKVKSPRDGATVFAHTNDATAFAMGRTMVAIIENHQTKDGKVQIPKVLQPFMGNIKEI